MILDKIDASLVLRLAPPLDRQGRAKFDMDNPIPADGTEPVKQGTVSPKIGFYGHRNQGNLGFRR
jgi:hypothetical protein